MDLFRKKTRRSKNNWVTSCYDWLGAVIVTNAIGYDAIRPQWAADTGDVLTYVRSGTQKFYIEVDGVIHTLSARDIVDELQAASHTITIIEVDSLGTGIFGSPVWPHAMSAGKNTNAKIYIDNMSYTNAFPPHDLGGDGIPDNFSFSDALLWELLNAYGQIIIGATDNEGQFTRRIFLQFKGSLDSTKDPFPFRITPLLYKDITGDYIPE